MARINSTIKMTDKASGPMGMIRQAVKSGREELVKLRSEASKSASTGLFDGMAGKIVALNQGIELAQKGLAAIKGLTNFTDNLTLNKARIDLMNDGLQKTAELQDMIYEAANRSRGSYDTMQKSVAKLGMLAGDAFKSSREIVGFTEMLNKAFVISGSSSQEIDAATYQLTQAMASGKLQGDEFRSLTETAPMLMEAIANYTGKTKGELKEMASEGAISSDIIKAAMFSAADDINAKFNEMPITFGQAATLMKNAWQKGMQGVADNINKAFNSEGFQRFLRIVIAGIERLGNIIGPFVSFVMTTIGNLVNFITTNWEVIKSILIGLAIVFLPMLIVALAQMAWGWMVAGLQAIWAGAKMLAAWLLSLGPIGWVILAIIAVIGILKMLGVSFEKIFGFIGGILGAFVAFVFNFVILPIWNKFAAFANFLGNVFNDPVYSIKKLFVDLLNVILDIVNSVAKVVDKVLGTNWSGAVTGFQNKMQDWLGKSDKYKEYVPMLEAMDFESSFKTGKGIGESIGAGLDKGIDKLANMFTGITEEADKGDKYSLDDVYNNGSLNTNVTGGKLDDVNISDEDLKMLKDIATREYMLNYKHITPNVKIEFGDVRETADVGKVRDAIRKMMEEELAELYVVEEA